MAKFSIPLQTAGVVRMMRDLILRLSKSSIYSTKPLLRIKAKGYRNRERFKLGVMFHYGKLNMAF